MRSSFLFGESINQEKIQQRLINSSMGNMKSQVLYIPDINENSAVDEFIQKVSPEILIISNVGEYKNLDGDLLLLDTDEVGAVRIIGDEKELVLN